MESKAATTRAVRVFRYDPAAGGEGHFERFEVAVEDESLTTVLDLLIRIQKDQDPSLAFRYACRVSMCGSCAMVINGREALACKSVVGGLKPGEITVRPLNHFPVVKDLVVDMGPFFKKFEEAVPFFEPEPESAPSEFKRTGPAPAAGAAAGSRRSSGPTRPSGPPSVFPPSASPAAAAFRAAP